MNAINRLQMDHSSSTGELSWGEIFSVWRKWSWLILLVALAGAAAAVAGSFAITPVYEAETVLLFDRVHPTSLGNAADVPTTDAMQRAVLVHSQIEILRSPELANTVIDELHLANAPMFNPKPGLLGTLIGRLRALLPTPRASAPATAGDARSRLVQAYLSHLSVRQDEDTYVLRLDVRATSGTLAAQIANAHAAAYLAWLGNQHTQAIDGAAQWLGSAVAAARARVVTSERAIEAFNARGTLLDANGRTVLDQSLAQLTTDLAKAQATQTQTQARADEIARLQSAGQIGAIVAMSDSPVLSGLETASSEVDQQVAANGGSLGARNPLARDSRARSGSLRAALNMQVRHIAEGARSQAAIARDTVSSLTDAIGQVKKQVIAAEDDRDQLQRLEGVAATERKIYLTLLGKLSSFDLVDRLVRPDATVLSQALAPSAPSVPRRGLMTMFGFILSGGLAAGIVAWRRNRQDAIRNTSEATSFAGVRCLGVMPYIERHSGTGLLGSGNPHYSFFREELRTLCMTLLRDYSKPGASLSVLVTSPLPGDGKSTFCDELGRFAAVNGVRTLIVRTDVNPGTRRGDPRFGDPGAALPVHPSHNLPLFAAEWSLPTAFLDQREMRRALDGWKSEYGLVIFDTPPLSAMAESIALTPIVDATLLLARVERTPRSLLANIAPLIERAGGNLAGLIVTFAHLDSQRGVVPSDPGYYFHKNRGYYNVLSEAIAYEDSAVAEGDAS